MTTEVRVRKIPAQTITETWYIASDGRQFLSEKQCKEHEEWLEKKEHYVFKTCVTDIRTLDDEAAVLYNLRNNNDHAVLISTFSSSQQKRFTDNYCQYGPGWYIYFNIDGGDGPDFPYLWNYDQYIKDRYEELDIWKSAMDKRMSESTD